jgi:energy-coupling factor transporter ATP-binding protein EcfA2
MAKDHIVPLALDELKIEVLKRMPRGTKLSIPQEIVLKGVWSGETFDSLAKEHEYHSDYLRTVARQMWSQLSPLFQQKVTKNNLIRLILDNQISSEGVPDETDTYGVPAKTDDFVGRQNEIDYLISQITINRCIVLSGAKGAGKTTLAAKLFNLVQHESIFNLNVWTYSEGQDLETDAEQIFKILKRSRSILGINALVDLLRYGKSLVVIDGVDHWLRDDSEIAKEFIKKVVEIEHNSCLVLTVRKPFEFAKSLEKSRLILNLNLKGFTYPEARQFFQSNGIDENVDDIIDAYRGLPSYLLYACNTIKYLGGDLEEFRKNKTLFITESDKNNLNSKFSNNNTPITDREKFILYFLYKHFQKNELSLRNLIEEFQKVSIYKSPQILAGIKELENQSLISITNSVNNPQIILHAEVRGYISEDPLSIFGVYDDLLTK